MPTSWTTRTEPSTSWINRDTNTYDSIIIPSYDTALFNYDGGIPVTSWTTRTEPSTSWTTRVEP